MSSSETFELFLEEKRLLDRKSSKVFLWGGS
jgi:hypothetical protein